MNIRHLLLGFAAAALLAVSGYALYSTGMNRGMKMAGPTGGAATAGTPQPAAPRDRKVLYWHDPMVPGQKFDKPGKSPFMDMQLVPVYADDEGDEGKVTISSRIQQNLGMRTAEVTEGALAPVVEAVGTVAYNERDLALVQARSNGFVEKLYVRAPLDPVRKGEPLAELYVPDWVSAQEEYLSARRVAGEGLQDIMQGLADGALQRMRLAGMTDDQIRLVASSGKVHARFTLRAPISGVIAELGAREGMTVMAGATLFRINGLDTVWVNAEVRESEASEIRPGNAVHARTPSLPGTVFKGRVGAILPEINPATRTIKARIELANPGWKLKPGMFATIRFAPRSPKKMLLVPTEAVIQTGKRSVVIVEQAPGKLEPVDVEAGIEVDGQTEIRKGLEAGQRVAVSGQFLIDSEANLKASTLRMEGALPASGEEAAPIYRGEGKVEKIGEREVTISHGPIVALQWGAMTMNFGIPPAGLPKNIAAGDSVTFAFRKTAGGFELTSIAPLSRAQAGVPAQGQAPAAGTGAPGSGPAGMKK